MTTCSTHRVGTRALDPRGQWHGNSPAEQARRGLRGRGRRRRGGARRCGGDAAREVLYCEDELRTWSGLGVGLGLGSGFGLALGLGLALGMGLGLGFAFGFGFGLGLVVSGQGQGQWSGEGEVGVGLCAPSTGECSKLTPATPCAKTTQVSLSYLVLGAGTNGIRVRARIRVGDD